MVLVWLIWGWVEWVWGESVDDVELSSVVLGG